MFPLELTIRAFRSSNGEFGWTREDARQVVSILASQRYAILGGELWWVPDGATDWTGSIPQRHGVPAVYPWETVRGGDEPWPVYVGRCASESLQAIQRWPQAEDLPVDLQGRILYNLTWVSEEEYSKLNA